MKGLNSVWTIDGERVSGRRWKGRGVDGGVSPRTGAGGRITLSHCAGTRRGCVCVGECSCSFCWMCLLGWRARSSDDVSHFLGGTRHGRCSRAIARRLEMRALDRVSTRSLAGFGCGSLCRGPLCLDSRMGTDQGIYPWVTTLVMGNLMGCNIYITCSKQT